MANRYRHPGLAAMAEVSLPHFMRAFRASTGETPLRFMRATGSPCHAATVKKLSRPLATIANVCGFAGLLAHDYVLPADRRQYAKRAFVANAHVVTFPERPSVSGMLIGASTPNAAVDDSSISSATVLPLPAGALFR